MNVGVGTLLHCQPVPGPFVTAGCNRLEQVDGRLISNGRCQTRPSEAPASGSCAI